jgi:hypothetical protein
LINICLASVKAHQLISNQLSVSIVSKTAEIILFGKFIMGVFYIEYYIGMRKRELYISYGISVKVKRYDEIILGEN